MGGIFLTHTVEMNKERLTYWRVGHDDHDVSVGREAVDVSGKHRVADLHAGEVGRHFAAAQLELFYDITDLLEPMRVRVRMSPVLTVRNYLRKKTTTPLASYALDLCAQMWTKTFPQSFPGSIVVGRRTSDRKITSSTPNRCTAG